MPTNPYTSADVHLEDLAVTINRLSELHLNDRIGNRLSDSLSGNFGGNEFHYFNYNNLNVSSNPYTTDAQPTEILTVYNVDFKVASNTLAHHTDRFYITLSHNKNPKLVVRRGQQFSVDVHFSRPYNNSLDDFKLIFTTGNQPHPSNGTYIEFRVSAEDVLNEWGAKITSISGSRVTIDVYTPPTCYISKWNMKIDVIKNQERVTNVLSYHHPDPIYIIFNPWYKDDSVYFSDQNLLNEYILKESGVIYMGANPQTICSKPWNYGQFEGNVLEVSLFLLEVSGMSWSTRGSATDIIRKLSTLVNSVENSGVLLGKWEGDFSDGTYPTVWTGSVPILEQFWITKQSVRYGQCWVFAGLCTSICRALGIPTRTITTFGAAHDEDSSMTADIIVSSNGDMDPRSTKDMIWNYHCWNECYIARPDLPAEYGGWQAFDATPQHTRYRITTECGPTPVKAVKKGDIHYQYDVGFLFSQVDSDVLYWKLNQEGVWEVVSAEKYSTGLLICTQAPFSDNMEDLTHTYKHQEGSPEERAVVERFRKFIPEVYRGHGEKFFEENTHDVQFTIVQNSDGNLLGSNFKVSLIVKNSSSAKRTASGSINVRSVSYTGAVGEKLQLLPFSNVEIQAGQEKTFTLEIQQDTYIGKLMDGYILDVSFTANIAETNQNFAIRKHYGLQKPLLSMQAPKEVKVSTFFTVDVSLKNPLKKNLTGCLISIDGVGDVYTFPQRDVGAGETFNVPLSVKALKTGSHTLIVQFECNEIHDINTSQNVFIAA